MVYNWVKTTVGAVLMANFSVPLYAVLKNRHLWDEPMAVLAGNMSLAMLLDGFVITIVGIYDLVGIYIPALCRSIHYFGFGFGIAFKVGHVCMALDQYVAVFHPLHHFQIMIRARPWLFAGTWLTCAAQMVFGLFANIFQLKTHADNVLSGTLMNSTVLFPECRWETGLADVFTIAFEFQLLAFSLATAGIIIFTGIHGHRFKKQIMKELRQPERPYGNRDQKLLDNYKAFKKIIVVLSLTVTLDIIAPIIRFYSRWYPMPKLNGFLHQLRLLGFIFEGWAYGLLNAKLRAAYKKTLCGTCSKEPFMSRVNRDERGPRNRPNDVQLIHVIPC